MSHLRIHSFTGNTDHDFAGLAPNQLLRLNNSGTAIESYGTASTVSFSSVTNLDYIDFNTATTSTVQTGRLIWNDADEKGGLEVGMKGGNVVLQIGEENLARVYNDDSVPLTDGMIVYVYSNQGNTISVRRASNTGETTSARALGMVTEPIAVGDRGYINTFGLVRDLDTSAYTGGTPLYVGATPGSFTSVKPVAPNHTCLIGFVSRVHATTGSIFIHISNGWELEELHDVFAPHSALTQSDLLYWDTGNTRWQATGTSALGIVTTTGGTQNYVPKFTAGGINLINSQIYDNPANGRVGVGTNSPSYAFELLKTGYTAQLGATSTNGGAYLIATDQGTATQATLGIEGGTGGLMMNVGTNPWFIGDGFAGSLMYAKITPTSGDWLFGQKGNVYSSSVDAKVVVVGNTSDNNAFALKVKNSGSTVLMAVRNDGYVGVGTSSPAAFLDVTSTGTSYANFILKLTNGASATKFHIYDNGEAYFDPSSGFQTVKHVSGRWDFPNTLSIGGRTVVTGDILTVKGSDSSNTNYAIKSINSSGLPLIFARNDGNVGIGTVNPSEKLHVSGGTIRINTLNGTEGAGKIAVSDANGSISFSSTTALGLVTSAGTVNKYSTTLTTPGANVTNTITHNLGTTDITATLWLVTTGDMTNARITNRQANSVDVIFASAPGENVRVVITG